MDLFRLIYHDQAVDPSGVFKRRKYRSPIIDTSMLRRIIFQVLASEGHLEYYRAIAERRRLEEEQAVAKDLLDEYTSIAAELASGSAPRNLVAINDETREVQERLDRLYESLARIKHTRTASEGAIADIEEAKERYLTLELKLGDSEERLVETYDERSRLRVLGQDATTELTQIAKIIHAHEQLNLFSADTCPFCLNEIERATGRCICGAEIDEDQYQRFFYSTAEYAGIFERKRGALSTIDSALETLRRQESQLKELREAMRAERTELRRRLRKHVTRVDSRVDVAELDTIDDKLLELKERLVLLDQEADIARKQEARQRKYDDSLTTAPEFKRFLAYGGDEPPVGPTAGGCGVRLSDLSGTAWPNSRLVWRRARPAWRVRDKKAIYATKKGAISVKYHFICRISRFSDI